MYQKLTIGLVGFGSVGSGIYHILQQKNNPHLHLKTIVVKDKEKKRSIEAHHFSYDVQALVEDPEINLVLELIDDAEAAYHLVKAALQNGKNVITANKKMLAYHLKELSELAQKRKVSLLYEAAVCGSIPIIKTLEESFGHEAVLNLKAISNGTCNYALTHLFQHPKPFGEIIKAAQIAGFAESDPSLDIDGWDSKFKLIISNYHASGVLHTPEEILHLGIRYIHPQDVAFAKSNGFIIKLLGVFESFPDGYNTYVCPYFLTTEEAISQVLFEYNAVQINTEFAEKQLLQGKGAGSIPTGSAVFADINALYKGYRYHYPKKEQNDVPLNNHAFIQIYASSTKPEKLKKLPFSAEIESNFQQNFAYKIGTISIEKLKNWVEEQPREVFVAVYP